MTPVVPWALLLLLSPVVGSLGGVLYSRLPEGRPVAWARSECERCGAVLGPLELVPILSFLLLRGRCRRCRAPIAPFHLAAELAAVFVAAVVILVLGVDAPPAFLAGGCVLGWCAALLAAIDRRWFLLPDPLTLPLLLAGLLFAELSGAPVGSRAAAAAGGYALFRAIELGYRRLRGRDGLGQGDAKLFAALGAWLGPFPMPTVLFAAAILTLVPALVGGLWRRDGALSAGTALPFGPGLAIAGWGCWLLLNRPG